MKRLSQLRIPYPLPRWAHFGLVLALFYLCGFLAPWWSLLVPAILFGGVGEAAGFERNRGMIGLMGAISWCSVAFVQDVMMGGRLSHRIAAVIGLPSAVFIYLLTGALAAAITGLGAEIGRLIFIGLNEKSETH